MEESSRRAVTRTNGGIGSETVVSSKRATAGKKSCHAAVEFADDVGAVVD